MADLVEQTRAFMQAYGDRANAALRDPPADDIEGQVQSFAAYFVGTSPLGVMGAANDDELRKMIPQGYRHYREVGGTRMEIVEMEIVQFDDFHSMAKVDWEFDYTRKSDGKSGTIRFANRYFVNFAGGAPKIFAFITPDETAAMQEHGLL